MPTILKIKDYRLFFFTIERNGMSTLANKSAKVLAPKVWFGKDMLYLLIQDGREFWIPLLWFPRLRKASQEQFNEWRLIGNDVGNHRETQDKDISASSLF
jgi:Protein of unknown function (DUF2442)